MTIFFDLDGTIADLYGVENWLTYLENADPFPYTAATPMLDFRRLARLLNQLQLDGYRIGIITWLSKNSTAEYDDAVRRAKRRWLARHLPSVDWDEVHMVKYGSPKNRFAKTIEDILFDDEEKNREKWRGRAYEPTDIVSVLESLL